MSIFFMFGLLKPKPFFDDRSDQITIISFANIDLKRSLIFNNIKVPIYVVVEVDNKKKFLEFINFLNKYIFGHFYQTSLTFSHSTFNTLPFNTLINTFS